MTIDILPSSPSSALRIRACILAVLVSLTAYFHIVFEPYVNAGPELLEPALFAPGMLLGSASDDAGHVRLESTADVRAPLYTQDIWPAQGVKDIRVSVQARAISIAEVSYPWQGGRVVLASLERGGTQANYHRPYELLNLDGTHDWERYSRVFHIYPGVDKLQFQVQLAEVTGILDIRQLSVRAVSLSSAWPLIQGVMISAFIVLLACVFSNYLRTPRIQLFQVLGLSAVFAILVFTSIPLGFKSWIFQLLLPLVESVPNLAHSSRELVNPEVIGGQSTDFFWIMHFLFFAAATGLILLVEVSRGTFARLCDMLTLAISTECIQAFVRDRGPSVLDVGVDAAGVLTGFLLWRGWMSIKNRRKAPALDPVV